MSAPATINVLTIAQVVLADRRKVHTISTLQSLAMCRALVAIADQDDQAEQVPACSATLAVAICNVVKRYDEQVEAEAARCVLEASDRDEDATPTMDARERHWDATDAVFLSLASLKTLFEKEFPNV